MSENELSQLSDLPVTVLSSEGTSSVGISSSVEITNVVSLSAFPTSSTSPSSSVLKVTGWLELFSGRSGRYPSGHDDDEVFGLGGYVAFG